MILVDLDYGMLYNEYMNNYSYNKKENIVYMESKELLTKLGDFFKIFADPTRIRILELLTETDKCVGEISEILGVSQSAISHQLKILRLHNVVDTEKNGQVVTYRLADDHIRIIIRYGLEHIKEEKGEKH